MKNRDYSKLKEYNHKNLEGEELHIYVENEKKIRELFGEFQKKMGFTYCGDKPYIGEELRGIYAIGDFGWGMSYAIYTINYGYDVKWVSATSLKKCLEKYKNTPHVCNCWDTFYTIFVSNRIEQIEEYKLSYDELKEIIDKELEEVSRR